MATINRNTQLEVVAGAVRAVPDGAESLFLGRVVESAPVAFISRVAPDEPPITQWSASCLGKDIDTPYATERDAAQAVLDYYVDQLEGARFPGGGGDAA